MKKHIFPEPQKPFKRTKFSIISKIFSDNKENSEVLPSNISKH